MATKKTTAKGTEVQITAPDIRSAEFKIIGTSPFVQVKFSEKTKAAMRAKMEAGSQATKSRKKEPRDFDEDFRQALHVSSEGWYGIPAPAFRSGMISACRLVGFKMTLAKLTVFVEADGVDKEDGTPLVKIEGTPEPVIHHVRNATGVADLRVRGMWREWSAGVRIQFDHSQFSVTDVTNLLARVGMQVGVGEGRPDSKSSAGMGWGTFRIAGENE